MSEEKESKSVESPLWKVINNMPKSLRQPNCPEGEVSVASGDNRGNQESEKVEHKIINKLDGKVINSTLNVNAAEFIPYSQQNQHNNTMEDIDQFLKDQFLYLNITPGHYNEILASLCEVLTPYKDDKEIMKHVINTILDGCIAEQNFRYSGVRLCTDMQKMFGNSFRDLLLLSCQEKFSNLVLNQSSVLAGVCSFGLVLAELYLQIEIMEKRITVLGEALLDLLNVLIKNKGEQPIKCVCQILKLTGVYLEENSETSPEKMEDLFIHLRRINQLPDLDPNLRFTVNKVIQLKDSNWGRETSEDNSPNEGAVNSNCWSHDEIVFYGPDGEIITDDEKTFLQENLPSSDDVEDCIDQFPKLNSTLRFSLNNVIQQNNCNWSRNANQRTSSGTTAVRTNGYVEYGQNGEVITDDEESFLQENLPTSDDVEVYLGDPITERSEDSMSDEMCDDYEKFLKLVEEAEKKG